MTTIARESEFRNKVLIPILFDNATKVPPIMRGNKGKIGEKVLQKRRLQLFGSVKDLYKKMDNSKQQSLALPQRQGKSLSLSATKFRKSSLSTFASTRKCNHEHSKNRSGSVYKSNIERLKLINQIQGRVSGSSQLFVSKGLIPIKKSQNNCYELDFEEEIPKFGDLRWLIETEQYNEDKLADIRKKIQLRNLQIKDLAQKQQQMREKQIQNYIQNIDLQGIDQRDILLRESQLKKFEGIPSFLQQLRKQEINQQEKFKTSVKSTKLTDSRLAVNKFEHGLDGVKNLMVRTSQYQTWKSPMNKQIENEMRELQQTLETKQQQVVQPKIMLEYLKQVRLKRVANKPQN